jgi:hypothetical protein
MRRTTMLGGCGEPRLRRWLVNACARQSTRRGGSGRRLLVVGAAAGRATAGAAAGRASGSQRPFTMRIFRAPHLRTAARTLGFDTQMPSTS